MGHTVLWHRPAPGGGAGTARGRQPGCAVAADRAFLTLPAGPRAYTGTIDIAEGTLAAYVEDILAGVYRLGAHARAQRA